MTAMRMDRQAYREAAAQAQYMWPWRQDHPWRARWRDLLDGLDDGLTEILRMLGIDRASRSQRRTAAALIGKWRA